MFINDNNIKIPEDPDTIVWKYLDLSKFVDLLLYKKLFLSRSDKFEDQYEGTFSEPTFEEIRKLSINNPAFLDYYKSHRENVVISSWHINEYESFAMWQIFTQKSEGLAIQSTLGRIQEALKLDTTYKQHIGEVNYIDYKKEYIPFDNVFFPFLFKRFRRSRLQPPPALRNPLACVNLNLEYTAAGADAEGQRNSKTR